MSTALSAPQLEKLRKQLLKKGAEINAKLVEILNGKQVSIEALAANMFGGGKPGETKEERLRRFLELVDSRIKAIRNGTYGSCQRCQAPLPFIDLEQIPWIDTCRSCSTEPF